MIMNTKFYSFFSEEKIKQALNQQLLTIKEHTKGSIIHLESDACTKVEVILTGQIDATRIDEKGNVFQVNRFKEGDVIGATLMYATQPIFPMTLTAKTDVKLIQASRDFINQALKEELFRLYFLEIISNQAQYLGYKIKQHMHQSIRDNVMLYLIQETNKHQTNTIELAISKKQLAENLGIQRTSLSRELKKMEEDQILLVDKKKITLLKRNLNK